MMSGGIADAVNRAEANAPYLRRLMARHPDVVPAVGQGRALPAADIDAPVARALRIDKQRTALWLALGDLAGTLPLEAVTRGLSDLADRSLDAAIAAATAERVPGAAPAGLVALLLGKGGSRELNFSSDVDPIFLFDPATLPRRAREEAGEAAVRITRRAVELMQARDADGYVFRVDLRLRPASEATPVALSADAAASHYESSALAWERAAFIRARAAAGDRGLGERFLRSIRGFVWRRSLDFGAVGELRALTRRIRAHGGRTAFGPGFDLKKGRGGIREIEFYAQIHQLIHGGREPALRAPATLDALAALAVAGRIEPEAANVLAEAYRLFRTIEHRLQMVEDRQTHELPEGEALDGVARLHGLPDGAALLALLAPHVEAVERLYDRLEEGDEATPPPSTALADAAAETVARWRAGSYRALRSPAALAALEAVLPALTAALARAPDPAAAFRHADRLFERMPSAINIFRLLAARPALLDQMVAVLAHAPALAEELARRPSLLDGLIDASALGPMPDVATLAARFAGSEADEDYGQLLDRVRDEVNERRFALGVQLVAGAADPLEVAAGHARVAEAAIAVLTRATVAEHERAHGRVEGAELVVLGLGRLGGAALTHASDLDLVYLFTGGLGGMSDGVRPLDATRYFNRLAQRVTAALSVPTAAGPLYKVDTRLRASGLDGLLCATVDSFADYQREKAWTWEHMALTRTRTVYGSDAARARLDAILAEVLTRPRDRAALTADVVGMRAEMAAHKPPQGALDVKLEPGGLVDLEFVVHLEQLATGEGLSPKLGEAVAGLVAAGRVAPALALAHALLGRMLVMLRLAAPGNEAVDAATGALVARACGAADWAALLAAHEAARQTVLEQWARSTGVPRD